MPHTPPPMHVFVVATGPNPEEPAVHSIEAAYYQADGIFTTFKDDKNAAVYSVRNDHLLSVERARDAEPVLAVFQEVLRQAVDAGHAQGTVKAKRPIGRHGAYNMDDFTITVAAQDDSDSAGSDGHVVVEVGGNPISGTELAKVVAKGKLSGSNR